VTGTHHQTTELFRDRSKSPEQQQHYNKNPTDYSRQWCIRGGRGTCVLLLCTYSYKKTN